MSHSEKPSIIQRLTQPFLYVWLQLRRFFFHLTLDSRVQSPVQRSTIYDADTESRTAFSQDSSPRTHANLPLSSSEITDLNTERSMHADYSEAVVDTNPPVEPETRAGVGTSSTYRIMDQTKRSSLGTQTVSAKTTRKDYVAARASEDDETNRMTILFGPPSPKRNLWMFVGTTGTLGLILAIILLFNGQPPEDVQIVLPKTLEPNNKVVEEKKEPEPDVKPEPTFVAKVEPKAEPKPEPPPIEDKFDVEVILLPGPPEKNQGEQFEVTGGDPPVVPNEGFSLVRTNWQQSDLLNRDQIDPWSQLQKLVPLEPFGPSDYVVEANHGGAITASYVTTQPRRGTQSLLLPYEMTVTNTGATSIDRVVMQQKLPESVELRDTSAVHAAENRTLRWEFEGLQPREQWTVPMVVVPTLQGQVKLPTTIDIGRSTSAKTLIQRPDIELSLTCEPAAQYKKYHQIVFLMKNTGEVPLNNLLIDVQLTGNLWHRFGKEFEFFHKQLDVGQTRRALLHVKTEDLGGANLQASLVTNEGANAGGQCEFAIIGNGEIEARGVETSTPEINDDQFVQPQPLPNEEPNWRERGSEQPQPKLVPENFDEPFARPSAKPRSLKDAAEATPVEKQPILKEATPVKQPISDSKPKLESKPADDFPSFPGNFEQLPERKPVPEKQPAESEPVKESPFDLPPKREIKEESKTPADDPSGPIDAEDEDPFAPQKKNDGFFD